MVEAQEWLNQSYSNKEEVRWIDGEKKQLTGELIIADFPQVERIYVYENQLTQLHLKNCPQLTYLECQHNKLTELTITNCPNLRNIYAYNNQLTNLDLSNNQQLGILNIRDNNFTSDLSFLSHLVNLKWLYLYDNNFTDSLKPLRNLEKLEILYINNTDLSQGLEYLPTSIKNFSCRGTELEKELKPFGGWKKWRETNKELIGGKITNEKLLVIANIIDSVANRSSANIQLMKVCQVLIFYLEEEVTKCRKELYQEREKKIEAQIQIPPK